MDETVIANPEAPASDGPTQIGTAEERDSFADYEPSFSVSRLPRLTRIGEYQIVRVLGKGGMGIVYQARHLTLKRDVAIKMMLAGEDATGDQRQRFLAEARAVAHLQHPHIVQIFEVGQHDSMPYFALELVEGLSLDQMLRNKTLSEFDAATLLKTLCSALQYAHDQGILHRDLKPSNVLMSRDGSPKLTDFGLARQVHEDAAESSKTKVGTIMGTPSYMSPEQARGDVHLLTPATDQYSLGAMLYEMLTGRPPFIGARSLDTVMQVIHSEPIAPRDLQPGLSVDLETICLKALQKDVGRRYECCAVMADDLARFLRGEPILARPVSRAERLWRWCQRNPVVASLSALASVSLTAVAVVSSWSAMTLQSKNQELTQRSERLQEFVQTMYDELREFDVDEAPRVKPARDRMLSSFNDIMLQVVEELPKSGNAEPVYAAVKMGLVDALVDQQRTEEAEKILEELKLIFERRVLLKNGSDAARNNLVLLLGKIGNLKRDLRRDLPASLATFQSAQKLAQEIVDHPKAADDGKGRMPVYLARTLLANTHTDLGVTWYRLGDPHQSLSNLERALALREEALNDFDNDPEIASALPDDRIAQRENLVVDLQFKRLGMGAALFRAGRAVEAEPLLRDSFDASVTAFQNDPRNPRLRHLYVGQAGLWAEFLGFTGRGPDALVVLEESARQIDDLLADDPEGVSFHRTATVALYRLSQWRHVQKQGDAEAPLHQCLTLRRMLAANEPLNDRRQLDLMLALARMGLASEAMPLIDKYLSHPTPDTELLIEAARAQTQLSTKMTGEVERDRLFQIALSTLQRAKALGFHDSVYLQHEPDFEPLRNDPKFQQLSATSSDSSGAIKAAQ